MIFFLTTKLSFDRGRMWFERNLVIYMLFISGFTEGDKVISRGGFFINKARYLMG